MPSEVTAGAFVIEDERFRRYTQANAPLLKLAEGFAWLEGPVWFADYDCLLFSDLPNDRIMRWSERGGLSVFREPAGFENGHARDMQGRLLGCSHLHRCITRTELDGTVTVLADSYNGKRLNSPNDVVCRSDGTIWFTDPHYGINTEYEGGKQAAELPAAVYRLDPDGGLRVVADDFQGPNGLCFSPDERRLYIAETGLQYAAEPVRCIRVFDVSADRRLSGGGVFHTVSPGYADGFRCDEDGNIWSGAGDGVHCIAPDGRRIGRIPVPFTVANLAFGGRNRARMFLCASHTLFAIYTNTRGAARP
jgi:gluconolactonase